MKEISNNTIFRNGDEKMQNIGGVNSKKSFKIKRSKTMMIKTSDQSEDANSKSLVYESPSFFKVEKKIKKESSRNSCSEEIPTLSFPKTLDAFHEKTSPTFILPPPISIPYENTTSSLDSISSSSFSFSSSSHSSFFSTISNTALLPTTTSPPHPTPNTTQPPSLPHSEPSDNIILDQNSLPDPVLSNNITLCQNWFCFRIFYQNKLILRDRARATCCFECATSLGKFRKRWEKNIVLGSKYFFLFFNLLF
jgi:hypothetical protein